MKKVDILFIHSNGSKKIYQELSKDHSAIEPPIWAAMLANHCISRGFEVDLIDCEAERLSTDKSAELICQYDARIYCFVVYGQQPSASTQNMVGSIDTAEKLKKLHKDSKVLFVGGHISALPRDVLQRHDCIDIICQNEGVYAISNLLNISDLNNKQELKKVSGIGFMDNGEVVLTAPQPIVPKSQLATDLPGMAWHLLPDMSNYRTSGWHSYTNDTEVSPFGALYTSLGCPYKCSFCMINIINRTDSTYGVASDSSNKFRFWDPEFIITQFDKLAEMGVRNIKIADELFVLNPRHFMKVCELIIERGYDFNIWAYSRIDTCKPKYLKTLKKAGVNWLGLGIENPDQVLRKEVHKDSFKDVKITDLFSMMRDEGMYVAANYIFGLPMDTQDSMKRTLEFAMKNRTEFVNMYTAMAYPGSPLYYRAKREGWELPQTYTGYSQHAYDTLNLRNKNLTAAEILKFRDDAWMTYHKDEGYLSLLENKFGLKSRQKVEDSTKIKLKRKILEEAGLEGQK
jgi:anaerobic magnesium-protoporphyrin IX monomethyl ester cyclase